MEDPNISSTDKTSFRSWIASEPDAKFPPEKGRYLLYISLVCPFSQRVNITRTLKGLEEVIEVVFTGVMGPDGWEFTSDEDGSVRLEPLYGFHNIRQLYLKAEPRYSGRCTVPVLWDSKTESIVNNESFEIMRMLSEGFDAVLPERLREASKPGGGLLPASAKEQIDRQITWIGENICDGQSIISPKRNCLAVCLHTV